MRKLILVLGSLCLASPAFADNIANCEAVMIEKLKEGDKVGAVIQTFAPAADIIASIYDDEEGHLTEIDGRKVEAILCQRSDVIPSLRDFPILATGIPFALSSNFEASDSRSVTVYFKGDKFHHVFKGPELSEDEQAKLDDAMAVFNLQPHGLGEKTKKKTASKKAKKDAKSDEKKEQE